MSELPKQIFDVKSNDAVVHSVLVWFQASKRRGTHSTLTRGEVSGGGKKPWKQKGTGRARAGSNRSPLWRKGGVIFGPKPRDYGYSLPKKIRQLGLKVALSDHARAGNVVVADTLSLAEAKTKSAALLLKQLNLSGKILVVLGIDNEIFGKAARNIKGVKIIKSQDLNIFDLLNANKILLEKSAISALKEALV